MKFSENDHHYMAMALAEAAFAAGLGEVPVGAVLVLNDQIIGRGYNHPIGACDPTAHAEIQAIRAACQQQNNYRLPGATLYVTLEPCAMCAGAIVHSRIARVVFAAHEPKAGALESTQRFFDQPQLNHRVCCESGLYRDEAGAMLSGFFRQRREEKKRSRS
ncbi:MAG: tRNA adenosine(34) deaminase TadA [Ketobacteraceae bacterium]|nr:tRNA adenosine(34) deaminase TadA [Ketobacteraceae bacterium]